MIGFPLLPNNIRLRNTNQESKCAVRHYRSVEKHELKIQRAVGTQQNGISCVSTAL